MNKTRTYRLWPTSMREHRPWQRFLAEQQRRGERAAYPPGHPVTWGLLTDGTPLDGVGYPYPVFEESG